MLRVAHIQTAVKRKPTKQQLRQQELEEIGDRFVRNHNEREIEKECARQGISVGQYRAMKEWLENNRMKTL